MVPASEETASGSVNSSAERTRSAAALLRNDVPVPLVGWLAYHLVPVRRRTVLANMRRVFGARLDESAIRRLAMAHYAHVVRSLIEIGQDGWRTPAARAARVRVENMEACLRAHQCGKGVLIVAAHLGNWEIASTGGLAQFAQYHGQFHVLRRPLVPAWLDRFVTGRFRRAGLGVLPKKGALDRLLTRLAAGDAVIFLLDQYAAGRDGVEVDFFGTPTGTFRSLAIIARTTGAPVVPVATWRTTDGTHVLRFEEALPFIECADPNEAIRRNTRAYNETLERLIVQHPEQWFWAHRRWKGASGR
jgi:KDO2-lipid IV(A) lauroyltransferase